MQHPIIMLNFRVYHSYTSFTFVYYIDSYSWIVLIIYEENKLFSQLNIGLKNVLAVTHFPSNRSTKERKIKDNFYRRGLVWLSHSSASSMRKVKATSEWHFGTRDRKIFSYIFGEVNFLFSSSAIDSDESNWFLCI